MPEPTQRGITAPQLQRYTGRYSPTSGYVYDQEFRGFDADQMEALARQYAGHGFEYSIEVGGGIATLRTVDTRGQVTIDIWEVVVNQTLVSAFNNPHIIATISPMHLALMAFAYTKDLSPAGAVKDFNEDTILKALYSPSAYATWPTTADAENNAATRFWERLTVLKQDSAFHDQYSIRHTTNCATRWPFNIADTNKNAIYTPSQFYAEVQSSSLWVFPMPQAFVNVLESNPVPPLPPSGLKTAGYFVWGYLKSGSPRATAANNRINIVTEYRQGLWSYDNYPLAS